MFVCVCVTKWNGVRRDVHWRFGPAATPKRLHSRHTEKYSILVAANQIISIIKSDCMFAVCIRAESVGECCKAAVQQWDAHKDGLITLRAG